MRCPVCSHGLRRVRSGTLSLDVCVGCKGIWFDDGEFAPHVKALSESDKIKPGTTSFFEDRPVHSAEGTGEGQRVCPKCDRVMKKFNYAYDSNIFLDKCTSCQGIWADAGESVAVARHLKADPKETAIAKDLVKRNRSQQDLREFLGDGSWAWYALFMPFIILPLADDTPRRRFPVVTVGIIVFCLLCFLGQFYLVDNEEKFLRHYGFVPANFLSIGLISSKFLHGGWMHLIGNMFFLWLFGDNIEDRFSRLGYLGFYLVCGLAASATHGVFNLDSHIPCIGASGAISGMMGAYLACYPQAQLKMLLFYRIVHVPAYFYLVFWFGLQLFNLTLESFGGSSGIGWYAHIGGFVFGLMFIFFRKRLFNKDQNIGT